MLLMLLACVAHLSYQARLIDSQGNPIPNAEVEFDSEDIICRSDSKGYVKTEKKLLPESLLDLQIIFRWFEVSFNCNACTAHGFGSFDTIRCP